MDVLEQKIGESRNNKGLSRNPHMHREPTCLRYAIRGCRKEEEMLLSRLATIKSYTVEKKGRIDDVMNPLQVQAWKCGKLPYGRGGISSLTGEHKIPVWEK